MGAEKVSIFTIFLPAKIEGTKFDKENGVLFMDGFLDAMGEVLDEVRGG